MTDWIEHTTDTCPVDPETVVEVRVKHGASIIDWSPPMPGRRFRWADPCITHYRVITPAPTTAVVTKDMTFPAAKPPEPEMVKSDWIKFTMSDGRPARYRVTAIGPNGAVPPTDDAPEVTFKCPLLEDPEPEMAYSYPDDAEAYAESKVRPEMNADAAAALKRQLADAYRAGEATTPITSHQPMDGHNLITLRLECLKLAVAQTIQFGLSEKKGHGYLAIEELSDEYLQYVLHGSVDKA